MRAREVWDPMIYAILGAVVVGLSLGIFGSGGSILTVPALVYLLGHPDKVAIAESLAIVGAIAAVAAVPYVRSRAIDWRTVILFGVPGMAGTYLGAWVAAFVAGYVQLVVFAAVMLLAAVQMWKRSRPNTAPPPPRPDGPPVLKIGADGLAVGVLTGFVGVGGGFLIVPALVLLGGLTMRMAVATSLAIIALKSAAGFVKYLDVLAHTDQSVDWPTIAAFVLFGSLGSFAGKAINDRVDQRLLTRGFAIFLVVMAGFIFVSEIAAMGDTRAADIATAPDSTPDR